MMSNPVVATELRQPEGPAFEADGRLVLVEMDESRECLTRLDSGGARQLISRPGGRPTGLAIDGDGCFWVAGGPGNSLVQLSPDGDLVRTIPGDDQGPFLFPNDLAFGPDGLLYMTDSGMRPDVFIQGLEIRQDFQTAPYDGRLFQIDPVAGRVLRRLDSGLRFANGIAFAADGSLLANESLTGWIYRYDPARERPSREPFANVLIAPPGDRFVGPDGMAFDVSGNLYCTVYGQGEVTVVDPSGTIIHRLATNGRLPTNVAFEPDSSAMVVTEVELGAVEHIAGRAKGLSLHRPRLG